jgi:hypothetical protein
MDTTSVKRALYSLETACFCPAVDTLDGGVFSNLKKLMSLHQGISKSLKTKLIDDYLSSYNKRK